ncbi:MAG: TonB family protein [Alphaproteobacteria bacterium]|nr:TonB family protein [Alphaproteobacteria bacterium]
MSRDAATPPPLSAANGGRPLLAAVALSLAAHGALAAAALGLTGLTQPPRPIGEMVVPVALTFEPAPEPVAETGVAEPAATPAQAEQAADAPSATAAPAGETAPPLPRVKPRPPALAATPAPPPSKPKPDPAPEAAASLAEGAADKAPPPRGVRPAAPQSAALSPSAARTEPRYGPEALGNAPPPYPAPARRSGIEGKVLLRVQVAASGRTEGVSVLESSGHALLDRAARRAVAAWRFAPATLAGLPVSGSVDIPVVFRLKD